MSDSSTSNFGSVEEAAAEISRPNVRRFDVHYLTIDGVVRKLWNADAEAYADHLLRLDATSRRNRLRGWRPERLRPPS